LYASAVPVQALSNSELPGLDAAYWAKYSSELSV
jgi:hypothetical protein